MSGIKRWFRLRQAHSQLEELNKLSKSLDSEIDKEQEARKYEAIRKEVIEENGWLVEPHSSYDSRALSNIRLMSLQQRKLRTDQLIQQVANVIDTLKLEPTLAGVNQVLASIPNAEMNSTLTSIGSNMRAAGELNRNVITNLDKTFEATRTEEEKAIYSRERTLDEQRALAKAEDDLQDPIPTSIKQVALGERRL
jgi:hypothetical protein